MTVTFAPYVISLVEENPDQFVDWLKQACGKQASHFDYRKQKYFFDAVYSTQEGDTTFIVGSIDEVDAESQVQTTRDPIKGTEQTVKKEDGTWWTKKKLWGLAYDPTNSRKGLLLIIESDCKDKIFFKATDKFKLDSVEMLFEADDFYDMIDEVKNIEWDHVGSIPLIPEDSPKDAFLSMLKDVNEHIEQCTGKYKATIKKDSRKNMGLIKAVMAPSFRKRVRSTIKWRSGYEDLSSWIQEGKQRIRPKLDIKNNAEDKTEKSIQELFVKEFLKWYNKLNSSIKKTIRGVGNEKQ